MSVFERPLIQFKVDPFKILRPVMYSVLVTNIFGVYIYLEFENTLFEVAIVMYKIFQMKIVSFEAIFSNHKLPTNLICTQIRHRYLRDTSKF
jgi:hypothetical protein